MAKKNLRICAGWCKRIVLSRVPGILTNQYLWDLNCLAPPAAKPAAKSKGMSPSATRCLNSLFLLQAAGFRQKKTCASAQVGVIHRISK